MGMVDKIRSGYRTARRYTGATALGLGIAAVPAAATYGLYQLYHNWGTSKAVNIQTSDPAEQNTRYRGMLHEIWSVDQSSNLISPASNPRAAFVWDPSRSIWNADRTVCQEHIIFSEGMDFGMRKALQMNDQATFMQLRSGVRMLSQDGLPSWKSFMIGGRLVIKNDRDAASALDADVGIAYNYLEAASRIRIGHFQETGDFTEANLVKESQQMMRIIYERGIQPVGPYLLFGPSEDWNFEGGALIYNVSYPALYMLEAFAKADPNPNHNWTKVVNDNQKIREEIIYHLRSLNTGQGTEPVRISKMNEDAEKADRNARPLQVEIPDWVAVTWSPENKSQSNDPNKLGFKFFTPGERSYRPGYDAHRTLLNIALDATLARDPEIRRKNQELARYLIETYLAPKPSNAPLSAAELQNALLTNVYKLGISTKDRNEVTGETEEMSIVCREMILGAFTALAYAAENKDYYQVLAQQLVENYKNGRSNKLNAPDNEQYCPSSTPYSQDAKVTKVPIEDRYYDQFIIWLATQSLESAYRRFDYEIYPSGTDKEKQDFCRSHACDYGILIEYVPVLGGHGFYVDPHERAELNLAKLILRRHLESWYDTTGLALDEAGSWSGLQYKNQAVLEYSEILRGNPSAKDSRLALTSLTGALTDLGWSGDQRIEFFRDQLSRSTNPYLKLGLAESLLAVYRKAETTEALELTRELAGRPDLELVVHADLISAQAYQRNGEDISNQLKNIEFNSLKDIMLFIDKNNIVTNPYLEPEVRDQLNALLARAKATPGAKPVFEDTEALAKLNYQIWFAPALAALRALEGDPGLSAGSRALVQLQLAELYLASGQNYFNTEDIATAAAYYRLIREADLPEALRPYTRLRLIEALRASSLMPYTRNDIDYYSLTPEQKTDLARDLSFIAAQNELAQAIRTVNPSDKIYLLQLLTRQMELNNLSAPDPLPSTSKAVDQILSLDIIPQYRLRGQFERIVYFLENNQLSKARADIESLLRMTDDLASRSTLSNKLLPEEINSQLRCLILSIRNYQQNQTNDHLESDLQATLGALTSQTNQTPNTRAELLCDETLNTRAGLLCDALQKMISQSPKDRYYEGLVALIQRILEENYLLSNIYSSENLAGQLLAQREEIEDLQKLLAGDQPQIANAIEDLNYIIDHSGEKAADSKLYKHLLGTYISVSWGLFNADFPAAEALMLEIVEKPHAETQNQIAQRLISTLRDKENRGFITELFGLSPGERDQVLFNLGEMYLIKGQKAKAFKVFCELLEINTELNGPELESAITAAEERSQANSPYVRELRKVLKMLD